MCVHPAFAFVDPGRVALQRQHQVVGTVVATVIVRLRLGVTAPGRRRECVAQVRAHGGTAPAVAELVDGVLRVQLREPLKGVAPGQAVAIYREDAGGDLVLASATIDATS